MDESWRRRLRYDLATKEYWLMTDDEYAAYLAELEATDDLSK